MQDQYIELPCQCDSCLYMTFWRNYQEAARNELQEETIVVEVCDRWTQTDPIDDDELDFNYEAHWKPGTLEHVILQQEILNAIERYNLQGAKDTNCNLALTDILSATKLPNTPEVIRKLRLRISRTISFSRFYNRKREEAQSKGTRLQDLLYNGNRKRKKRQSSVFSTCLGEKQSQENTSHTPKVKNDIIARNDFPHQQQASAQQHQHKHQLENQRQQPIKAHEQQTIPSQQLMQSQQQQKHPPQQEQFIQPQQQQIQHQQQKRQELLHLHQHQQLQQLQQQQLQHQQQQQLHLQQQQLFQQHKQQHHLQLHQQQMQQLDGVLQNTNFPFQMSVPGITMTGFPYSSHMFYH